MTRNGGLHESNKESPEAIAAALKIAGEWRTAEAQSGLKHAEAPAMFEIDQAKIPVRANSSFKDAATYYGMKRGFHPRSDRKVPPMSHDLMIGYDSFDLQHLIAPWSLLMCAGLVAQTFHRSRTAIDAAMDPKELYAIQRQKRFDLFDGLTKTGRSSWSSLESICTRLPGIRGARWCRQTCRKHRLLSRTGATREAVLKFQLAIDLITIRRCFTLGYDEVDVEDDEYTQYS